MLITPIWMRVSYFLGALAISLAGVAIIIRSFESVDSALFWTGWVYVVGGNLAWRVLCEFTILFFSMHDQLVELVKRSDNKSHTVTPDQVTNMVDSVRSAEQASFPVTEEETLEYFTF